MSDDTLLDVIDRLTIEHPYAAHIDGRTRWVRRDPLIAQLRGAIASSLVGGAGPGTTSSKIPFDSDALEQYDRLDGIILEALRDAGGTPHLTPEGNLRAWYATVGRDLTEEGTRIWFAVYRQWEQAIEAKLEAPIVLELIDMTTRHPFTCPDCGMDWFEQVLNSGPDGRGGRWYDREKRVALTAMYRPDGHGGLDRAAVECGCCGWRVTGNDVRGFAWDLEQGAPEVPREVSEPSSPGGYRQRVQSGDGSRP